MELLQGQSISRVLYPQTGDYRAVLEVDPMPSYLEFALASGGGDQALYTFDNKRFIDYLFNFSHVYATGGPFKFELVKKGQQINTWINDTLSQSYVRDAFFPNYISQVGLGNSSSDTEFTFSFYGERPNLTFSDLTISGGSYYSGSIYNSSLSTRLFGVTGVGVYSVFPSTITGGTTGYYSISGDLVSGLSAIELEFDFDYGKDVRTITIIDSTYGSYAPTGFLNFAIDGNTVANNQSLNYSITNYAPNDSTLNVEMFYVERIGNMYGTGTGVGTGRFTGFLDGSGYLKSYDLTGIVSGYPGSGYGILFTYGTGELVSEYLATVTGYEQSGIFATGILQGYVTGIVGPGSGHYRFQGQVIGTPSISIWDGGIFTSPTGLYTGRYDYFQNIVGEFSQNSTGNILVGANKISVDASGITGNFSLTFGDFGETGMNYHTSGWYSGDYFIKQGGFTVTTGEVTNYEGQIGYSGGINGVTDVVEFSVYNNSFRYDTEIRGTLQQFTNSDRIFAGYKVIEFDGNPVYRSVYYYPATDEYVLE